MAKYKQQSDAWWVAHEKASTRLQDCFKGPVTWAQLLADRYLVSQCTFDFAYLEPNAPDAMPATIGDIKGYANAEVQSRNLEFIRTANIGGVHYWIWRVPDLGGDAYVVLECSRNASTLGSVEGKNYTPEQALAWIYIRSYGESD